MNTIKTIKVNFTAVTIDGLVLCYTPESEQASAIHGAFKQLHDTASDYAKVLHEQGFTGNEWYQSTLDNINGILIQLGLEPVIIRGTEVSHE